MFTYMIKDLTIDDSLKEPDVMGIFIFILGCIITIPVDLILLPLEILAGIIYFIEKKRRKDK